MQHVFDFYGDRGRRPRNPERLFFCVMPDDAVSGEVMQLGDRLFVQHALGGSRLRRDRLHMSLHPVGDYPRLPTKVIYAASRAARTVLMAPFEIRLRTVQSFEPAPHKRNRRPLVLLGEGGDALPMLFRNLGMALLENGLKAAASFTPHMTLSYGPQPVPMQPIEPIRFQATDFVLIHSRLGLTQYEVIDRWPLAA
jgi:RNA 2',3'-cyclic 3'-phosphodiesterase